MMQYLCGCGSVWNMRSILLRKVRTKVMVCPWRVFEVGIHHVSKQNRNQWRSFNVDPSVAYLHHYRRCASGYGMNCFTFDQDTTVADRYSDKLTANFISVVTSLYEQEILKTGYS
ncbi:hypothetical protein Btru_069551 [Bulinus truncatus]|nr:hypothetical protein Btru_069551 [Bulinus truncatus]